MKTSVNPQLLEDTSNVTQWRLAAVTQQSVQNSDKFIEYMNSTEPKYSPK